ncbi:hypothetical protein AVEN_82031-1 [Araneus ventricosus]|uniref:Uncharacterized protein n=1 Tax=Araneus ventricosus TaxID=182803 RepID=A0A4Y2VAM4_ARAVE|nr:hypothetical protein AVEN_82031-1 [Araneus ventricosus]
MRSWKQTERQQLLMESPLAYPRGKEEKAETQKEGKNSKGEQTLGYVGVVNTVTSREDVPHYVLLTICLAQYSRAGSAPLN